MSNWESFIQSIEDLPDDIKDGAEDAVDDSLNQMERTSKGYLRHNDTNYRGDVRRSHRIQATKPNGEGQRGFVKKLSVGGPSAPHTQVVEFGSGTYFGRSPFDVPKRQTPIPSPDYISEGMVANINEWIDEKGIQAHSVPQASLGIAISQSIVEKGSPGQPFFRPTYYQHERHATRNVRSGVNDAIRNV